MEKARFEKIPVDIVVYGLAGAVTFPYSYKGKEASVGWEVNQVSDVSIAGREKQIVWIGRNQDLDSQVTFRNPCEFINGSNLIAIPGFVDSHTHLVYSGSRSDEFEARVKGKTYLEILSAGGGILNTVANVRKCPEEELFRLSKERVTRMIECGTTTVEIKSGYGLDLTTELKILQVIGRLKKELPIEIVSTFMGAHAIPEEFKFNPEKFVSEICKTWIPEISRQNLAEFIDVFIENKAFSVEQARKILECGKSYGLKLKAHVDEINVIGGLDLTIEMGAVSADHLLKTEKHGISKLSGSSVIPTLLPGTSTFLMETRHANAREMISAGLPVAIASDYNPGSCQFFSPGMIQSLAMLQLKLNAGEALIAGTLHGAFALDRGWVTGAIEIGKRMDLALLDLPSFRDIGYRVGWNPVRHVIASGKIVKLK
ncbi:imidazolonepropionase [bacterium]|nr:imidazolonepropionase [bacterium]